MSNKDDIVSSWIAVQREFWACDELSQLCRKDPMEALSVIVKILASDDSVTVKRNLAAGPLEELLLKSGETVIADIEKISMDDSNFRNLLDGVWGDDIDIDVWNRVLSLRDFGD